MSHALRSSPSNQGKARNPKFSVIIPAFNAAKTIERTLDSVLSQTITPDEVLVFDDGSTDNTAVILESYKSRITVFRESNQGVANARNFLCARAQGEILAFLDADDLWHPNYLKIQTKSIQEYPNAAAYFTEHVNLIGYGDHRWPNGFSDVAATPELISPEDFMTRYDRTPLSFQMSCFCLRRDIVAVMGKEPFPVKVSGADDTYLHNMLPLVGSVLHVSEPLVAYRIIASSISANRLKMAISVVEVFEMLRMRYQSDASRSLYREFKKVFASRRRNCGKYQMGAGRVVDARRQFLLAAQESNSLLSIAKSLGQYCLSHLPHVLQPVWPAEQRASNADLIKIIK